MADTRMLQFSFKGEQFTGCRCVLSRALVLVTNPNKYRSRARATDSTTNRSREYTFAWIFQRIHGSMDAVIVFIPINTYWILTKAISRGFFLSRFFSSLPSLSLSISWLVICLQFAVLLTLWTHLGLNRFSIWLLLPPVFVGGIFNRSLLKTLDFIIFLRFLSGIDFCICTHSCTLSAKEKQTKYHIHHSKCWNIKNKSMRKMFETKRQKTTSKNKCSFISTIIVWERETEQSNPYQPRAIEWNDQNVWNGCIDIEYCLRLSVGFHLNQVDFERFPNWRQCVCVRTRVYSVITNL